MPLYTYLCDSCKRSKDVIYSSHRTAEETIPCSFCGKTARRVLGGAPVTRVITSTPNHIRPRTGRRR